MDTMFRSKLLTGLKHAFFGKRNHSPIRNRRGHTYRPLAELLETRITPAVSLITQFIGIAGTGSVAPPDTSGAAGSGNTYVESVNLTIRLTDKAGGGALADSFSHFMFTVGGLPRAGGSPFLSDPITVWDEQIGRFIVGVQDTQNS